MGLKLYSNFILNVSRDRRFTTRKAIVDEDLQKGT
jgi:hypothetical protein